MRTVLTVNPSGEKDQASGADILQVNADRAPFEIPLAGLARPVRLSADQLPDWAAPQGVQGRGRRVRDALRQHPGIAALLDTLENVPVDQVQPIFVRLRDGNAELIAWETLCDAKDRFVALDRRWPVGRISDPMAAGSRPSPVLRLPVRVMAAISALGVDGQKREWEWLRDAADAAHAEGLDVRLRVVVGDAAWRPEVEAAIAGGRSWLEVTHVEKTGARLVQEIARWKPNVLHFFCHGHSGAAGQALVLGTASDFTNGAATGSVKITIDNLGTLAQELPNPWLLTLNCCSGAEAASDLQSMAYHAVSSGFPAAVGMLEPVDASDAHEFTRAFYGTLFKQIRQASHALELNARAPFEWAGIMYDARTAICQLHANDAPSSREWALPVLYVRGMDAPVFERPPVESEAAAAPFKLRARTFAAWLQGPGAAMTPELRLEIMKMTLHDVPASYWPSADGTFPDG
ncbi:MAG: CHAT domain-containing protein [Candidatus Rokuibacteriota bacterium]